MPVGTTKTASLAELKAIASPTVNDIFYLRDVGKEGEFVWDTSILPTSVPAGDARLDATIIKHNTVTTGVFRRIFEDGMADVKWYGAVGNGTTNDAAAIQNAVNASDTVTIIFDNNKASDFLVNTNITVPAGKVLKFRKGNRLTGTATITGGIIDAPFDANIFATTLTVNPEGVSNRYFSAQWFGAKIGTLSAAADIQQNTVAVQKAINTYGVVVFGEGQFYVNTLYMQANKKLYGSGKTKTILVYEGSDYCIKTGIINLSNSTVTEALNPFDMEIKDLSVQPRITSIVGSGGNQNKGAIYWTNAVNSRIENVYLNGVIVSGGTQGFEESAIVLEGRKNPVQPSSYNDNTFGIVIKQCKISSAIGNGIRLFGTNTGTNIIVKDTEINACGGRGFSMETPVPYQAWQSIWLDNVIFQGNVGVHVLGEGVTNFNITRCYFETITGLTQSFIRLGKNDANGVTAVTNVRIEDCNMGGPSSLRFIEMAPGVNARGLSIQKINVSTGVASDVFFYGPAIGEINDINMTGTDNLLFTPNDANCVIKVDSRSTQRNLINNIFTIPFRARHTWIGNRVRYDDPLEGTGSPEGVVFAAVRSYYFDTANNRLYVKRSEDAAQYQGGNTGWIAL
jgi:hypothetical protein